MKKLITVLAVLGMAPMAWAQNADDYRGGWRTEAGDPHIYQFSIRGDQVRGVYCTRCSDATTLAFIDGTLGAAGLTFTVTHVKADGSTSIRIERPPDLTGVLSSSVAPAAPLAAAASTGSSSKIRGAPTPFRFPYRYSPQGMGLCRR